MFKKMNALLLSLFVVVGFCGDAKSLTLAQGQMLAGLRQSFTSASNASALTGILNDLGDTKSARGAVWRSISTTNDALQVLNTGAGSLSQVLEQNKFSTSVASSNSYMINDASLRAAVIAVANSAGTIAANGNTSGFELLKTKFNLVETKATSAVQLKSSAAGGRKG